MNMHTTLSGVHTPAVSATIPQPCQAEIWQSSPVAIGLVAAIADLHLVASRLKTLQANDPTQHEARSAAELVGRIVNKSILRQFGRGREMEAAPSNGACAISTLWDALSACRERSIEAQMEAEGLPLPWADGLTQERRDASFDRQAEIDRDALSVAQVVCLALAGGRG
jgi:hypothetical protein